MNYEEQVYLLVDYVPARGRDKHTRINSVAPVFESGMVLCPFTDEKFAQDVIEECSCFSAWTIR